MGDAIAAKRDASGRGALLEQLRGAHERLKLDLSEASLAGQNEASLSATDTSHHSACHHHHHNPSFTNPALSESFQLPVAVNGTPPPLPPVAIAGGPVGSKTPGDEDELAGTVFKNSDQDSVPTTAAPTAIRETLRSSGDAHYHPLSSDAQRLQLRVDRELERFSTICKKLIRRCAAATLQATTPLDKPDHYSEKHTPNYDPPSATLELVSNDDDDDAHSRGGTSLSHPHPDRLMFHILRDRTGVLEAALANERAITASLRQALKLADAQSNKMKVGEEEEPP